VKRYLLVLIILLGCGGDNATEPDDRIRYPTAGVWAGWSDMTAFGETEPLAKVVTKFDLDLNRILWGDRWSELDWEVQLYGTPPGVEGGVILVSWGRCSGAGHLEGNELLVFAHCDTDGYNIEFRGVAE